MFTNRQKPLPLRQPAFGRLRELKHAVVERIVFAFLRQQLCMGAAFEHAAVFKHQNGVGVADPWRGGGQ